MKTFLLALLLVLQCISKDCIAQIHTMPWDPGSITPEQKKYLDACEAYLYDTLGNIYEGSSMDNRRMWLDGNYFEYIEIDSTAHSVSWKFRKSTEAEKAERKWMVLSESNIDSLIGKKLLDMEFTDLDGKKYRTAQFSDKVVYMNFWFVGCQPCELERVKLNQLHEQYKENENVIFLSFSKSNERKTRSELSKKKHLWPTVVMNQDIKNNLSYVWAYPTNVIVNNNKYALALSGLAEGTFLIIDEKLKLLVGIK